MDLDTVPAAASLREREGELTDVWSATSIELRQLDRALRRMQNRLRWRRLYQRRSTLIAAAIRGVERVITKPSRDKSSEGWLFFDTLEDGSRILAATLHTPKPRTFADFSVPIEVELVAPELVDEAVLLTRLGKLAVTVR